MMGELDSLLTFVLNLLRDYGLNDFYLELSTRNPAKSVGSDEAWEQATDALRQAAEKQNLEFVLDPEGAAFYGPKISVQAKDAIGRTWQMSTIQLDFNLPERFELEYTSADNTRERPVMIHRALFGSIERFFAILTEHYAGQFPVWLAPVQVLCIPVAEAFNDYLVSDGLPHIYRLRAKEKTLDRPAVERYTKSPKALVRVGNGKGGDSTKPLGLPLEIVPLADPFGRKAGEALKVRVLFQEKPLAAANLGWDHPSEADGPAGTVRTDRNGEALIPIAQAGLMTIRLTHMTRPKAKDYEWESFWTTLTFRIE